MRSDRPGEDANIEALRGFAALMVVAAHYAGFVIPTSGPWGFAATGVDLFFVLSGYVFGPYLFGRPLAWGPHLVRRAFRLYPLYLVALAAYVALKLPDPAATRYLIDHLLMAHTLRSPEVAFFYNPAFWSLPPEVEFYLVLPLLALLPRVSGFYVTLVAAAVLHLVLVAFAVPGEGATARALATVHLPGLLVEFCLGAWAWRRAGQEGPRTLRIVAGLALLVAVAVVHAVFVGDAQRSPPPSPWIGGNIGFAAAIGYALLVSGLAGQGNPCGWRLRASLFAGTLSYGVYLFHNAAPQLVDRFGWALKGWPRVAVCLALTLAVAWLLHRVVEAPARNFGRNLSARLARREPLPAQEAVRSK